MDSNHSVLSLPPRHPLGLHAFESRRLTVARGRLWLTESGSRADHFLSPGDSFVVRAGRRAVVECDRGDRALFTVERVGLLARAARLGRSAAAWLAGRIASHRDRARRRHEARQLQELSEHQLRDIGAPEAFVARARGIAWSQRFRAEHGPRAE